jgi:cyclic pyranopterin phosphate synthase
MGKGERMVSELKHFNPDGEARMIEVGDKPATRRKAIAEGRILMKSQTLEMIASGEHRKGDVLGVARLAGIMAAKRTAELIPLCHPLALTGIELSLEVDHAQSCVRCRSTVETVGPTGVEMEALTAVQVALLTVYDMCKAVERGMTIEAVRLVHKSGGKSGDWSWERQA